MSYLKEKYAYDSLPELPEARAELLLRPDLLRVPFSLSLEKENSEQALPLLQRAGEQLHRRVRDVLGGDVRVRQRDVRFNRSAPKKLSLPDDEDRLFTAVEGLLEVPLATELDFWARAARVKTLSRVCHELERDSREEKRTPRFVFGALSALVADPELHRAELLRRFVTRMRELAAVMGSPEAPLHVVDCSAPGPVEQNPISLEEVGLSLHVSCRLGVFRMHPLPLGEGGG